MDNVRGGGGGGGSIDKAALLTKSGVGGGGGLRPFYSFWGISDNFHRNVEPCGDYSLFGECSIYCVENTSHLLDCRDNQVLGQLDQLSSLTGLEAPL